MPVDVSQFLKGLGDSRKAQLAAAVRAVDKFGEQVIGDAQQLTPVKTGTLQGSGTTLPAEVSDESIDKTVGFNTNYAAAVHEKLNNKHAVGQAKFLETAMKEDTPKFGPFVADRVRSATSD